MEGSESLTLIAGPLIAVAVLGGLALTLLWAFRSEQRSAAESDAPWAAWDGSPWPTPDPYGEDDTDTDSRDYGLLKDVAIVDGPAAADALRDALALCNIRTTVVIEGDGRIRVLVFDDELDHARRVLG
ncbi:hypothetical protein [Longispora albida]|uniref:hypothetical protein n=1 Tax=Longispora albida TaxID=203523 RepID=UPI00036F54E5|nr:hypothetical protein [Longispora albida]